MGPVSTDFLIERDGQRIALECRLNVQRDLERAILTANFPKKELGCYFVITVVPFDISETSAVTDEFVTATPCEVIDLHEKEAH